MPFSRRDAAEVLEDIELLCAPSCARDGCSHSLAVHKRWNDSSYCGTKGCSCDSYQTPRKQRQARLTALAARLRR